MKKLLIGLSLLLSFVVNASEITANDEAVSAFINTEDRFLLLNFNEYPNGPLKLCIGNVEAVFIVDGKIAHRQKMMTQNCGDSNYMLQKKVSLGIAASYDTVPDFGPWDMNKTHIVSEKIWNKLFPISGPEGERWYALKVAFVDKNGQWDSKYGANYRLIFE